MREFASVAFIDFGRGQTEVGHLVSHDCTCNATYATLMAGLCSIR